MRPDDFPIELIPVDAIPADDLRVITTPGGHYMLVASFDDGRGARVVAKIAMTRERWDKVRLLLPRQPDEPSEDRPAARH